MLYHVEIRVKDAKPPHRNMEVEHNLSFEEVEQRFLSPHRIAKPMVIRGRAIAIDDLHRIRIYASRDKVTDFTSRLKDMVTEGTVIDVTNRLITWVSGMGIR